MANRRIDRARSFGFKGTDNLPQTRYLSKARTRELLRRLYSGETVENPFRDGPSLRLRDEEILSNAQDFPQGGDRAGRTKNNQNSGMNVRYPIP